MKTRKPGQDFIGNRCDCVDAAPAYRGSVRGADGGSGWHFREPISPTETCPFLGLLRRPLLSLSIECEGAQCPRQGFAAASAETPISRAPASPTAAISFHAACKCWVESTSSEGPSSTLPTKPRKSRTFLLTQANQTCAALAGESQNIVPTKSSLSCKHFVVITER